MLPLPPIPVKRDHRTVAVYTYRTTQWYHILPLPPIPVKRDHRTVAVYTYRTTQWYHILPLPPIPVKRDHRTVAVYKYRTTQWYHILPLPPIPGKRRRWAIYLWWTYGICKGTFEIVSKEVLWSVRGLIQQYEVPLSRMFHDILDDDHRQWHPLLIRHYTNFWPYYWSWPYNRIWLFT